MMFGYTITSKQWQHVRKGSQSCEKCCIKMSTKKGISFSASKLTLQGRSKTRISFWVSETHLTGGAAKRVFHSEYRKLTLQNIELTSEPDLIPTGAQQNAYFILSIGNSPYRRWNWLVIQTWYWRGRSKTRISFWASCLCPQSSQKGSSCLVNHTGST